MGEKRKPTSRLGGPFPTTIWSSILAAGDPSNPQFRESWTKLIQNYWKPVYAFIRATWHKQVEDSKDLTQAFFTYFLQKDYLSRMRPERGSFRSYLRQALRHFLIDMERHQEVRHPSEKLVKLEDLGDLDRIGVAGPGETPEEVFDREWFDTVVEQAIRELKSFLSTQRKDAYFDLFRVYCLEEEPDTGAPSEKPPTYVEVARRLNIKVSEVRNHLTYCRNHFRRILCEIIRQYVSSESEVEEELREVMSRG